MLKSRKNRKEVEGLVSILSYDFGEVLAESFAARHFSALEEEEFPGMVEKLRSGLLLFMTPAEVSELKRRVEQESSEE